MKLLFFSPYYLPYVSGITMYPSRVLPDLPEKIHVTVLTFKHDSSLADQETIDGVRVVRMPFLTRLSKGFISPQSLLFFWRELKTHDVLLINLPSVEGLPAALLAKCMRKKVIVLFHCDITLKNNFLEKILSWLVRSVVIVQLWLSQRIIAYTKDYIESLPYAKIFATKTSYCLPPVAHESVDEAYFKQLKQLKKSAYWVGCVGRIAREKGIEYAIEAVRLMPKTATLVLVGPKGNEVAGEARYFARINDLLTRYKIPHLLLPTLRGAKLAALYRSLDILLLPSLNQTEAFGMVQAEAMLQGTPVVATNLPGVRATIKATGTGIVVEPKNAQALAYAIKSLLQQPLDRQVTAQKAAAIFSTPRAIQNMVQVIDTMA